MNLRQYADKRRWKYLTNINNINNNLKSNFNSNFNSNYNSNFNNNFNSIHNQFNNNYHFYAREQNKKEEPFKAFSKINSSQNDNILLFIELISELVEFEKFKEENNSKKEECVYLIEKKWFDEFKNKSNYKSLKSKINSNEKMYDYISKYIELNEIISNPPRPPKKFH